MPKIEQDTIEKEDQAFREYLLKNGYDVTQMGNEDWQRGGSAEHEDTAMKNG